ncbi:non-classical arabinogalactan protein 31-like [Lycium barbarum]|uniref:non-classical arabinogalactan protein 31-like n=1 Tax=Lycium barbarum TaxID=112863 RepID=UPI00293E7F6C|nr:non-classical arabinogalactan protein 31-like [Lycium barbarum]
MGFVPSKSLGFILALLLITSFTVLGQNVDGIVTSELAPHSLVSFPPVEAPKAHKGGHHHHHHHKHSQAPASSPTHSSPTPTPSSSPVKPPTPPAHSPVKPPSPLPTRKFVGVRGVVYCKSCKYRGVNTLLGASPIQGAVVKLACNNTKYHLTSLATTAKNGYFFIQPKWLTTAGYHKCKVFIAKSPKPECSVPTNFHNGQTGAMLTPAPPSPMTSSKPVVDKEPGVKLFDVGPFAFEPSKNLPCK